MNRASGLLLALGLGLLVAVTVRSGRDALTPASAAALLWLFATAKVYSAQYALWIMLALALAAVPLAVAALFAAIDVLFFTTLWGGLPWLGDFPAEARQVVTVAMRLARPSPREA